MEFKESALLATMCHENGTFEFPLFNSITVNPVWDLLVTKTPLQSPSNWINTLSGNLSETKIDLLNNGSKVIVALPLTNFPVP